MDFDWSHYLTLARELVFPDAPAASLEAKQRSAISRAYYAAYHLAREHVAALLGWKPNTNTSVHQNLITFLKWN